MTTAVSPGAQPPGAAPIADTALPAAVRTGSDADKRAYKAAMGFEQMMLQSLLGQLAQTSQTSAPDDDDADSGLGLGSGGLLGGGGPWASQIQETLAQQLASGGGIGLAQQLYAALKPDAAGADASADMPAANKSSAS